MQSIVPRRRALASALGITVLGLTAAIVHADPPPELRKKVEAKLAELIKRLEEQLEIKRQAEITTARVNLLKDAVGAGRGLPKFDQGLARQEWNLHQVELERDLMAEQYGANNPRFKAIAERAKTMRLKYEDGVEEARLHADVALIDARKEDDSARKRLDGATKAVETAKQELLALF